MKTTRPNISEFDGDKDYFDYDEERPERDKYDAPPVLRRGRAAGAAAEAEEDEEGNRLQRPRISEKGRRAGAASYDTGPELQF